MSDEAVEEIPLCGWNWMGSSEGRDGGDTWCRGCCQSLDSRAFVFSIITRSTSFLPHSFNASFLPERSILPSLFQFFPEVISIINQWIISGHLISLIGPCVNPPQPELTYVTLLSYFLSRGWNNDEIFTQTEASVPTVLVLDAHFKCYFIQICSRKQNLLIEQMKWRHSARMNRITVRNNTADETSCIRSLHSADFIAGTVTHFKYKGVLWS